MANIVGKPVAIYIQVQKQRIYTNLKPAAYFIIIGLYKLICLLALVP